MPKRKKLKYQILAFIMVDILVWSVIIYFLPDWVYSIVGDAFFERKIVLLSVSYCVGSVILLCLFTLPLVFFLIKNIDSPIQRIASGMEQITKGNYDVLVDIPSDNEFGKIHDAFNYMSMQLKQAELIKQNAENERILLFTSMAHDLKTPITTILGFSKAMAEGMVPDKEKQSRYLQTIASKASRMNELINRVFEYAKIDSSDSVFHKEKTDLTELLRECVASVFTEFESRYMEISIRIPDEQVLRVVDRLEIGRVFSNLLDNVLKHNLPGTKVLVQMDTAGCVTIADAGTAIQKDVAERLFTPFVTGDNSRMSSNGSGLGLALSYKVMKKHGGSLVYQSAYPGYTKAFIVSFQK